MEWITGLQKAIEYIEAHLSDEIDYDTLASQSFSSSYHFQRIFSIICGFTIGEYIRNRRLSLAGAELASGKIKVIDAALKYGYESPDSFAKAFRKFHGISPSQAKNNDGRLKSFSPIVLKISYEGGRLMNYRIEEKPEMILTGYKARFSGAPYGRERAAQEENFFITTRGKQWFLDGINRSGDIYCVINNVTDEGYDFCYCNMLDQWDRDNMYNREVTGVDFIESLGLEHIVIPANTYVIFETGIQKKPTQEYKELIDSMLRIITEWMPEMGFQLKPDPELSLYHWLPRNERNIQIWLPIEKIK